MKKKISLLLVLCVLICSVFAGCSGGEKEPGDKTVDKSAAESVNNSYSKSTTDKKGGAVMAPAGNGVDIDLTALSSTMVYSEVYNMVNTPDDYMGKTVRMRGVLAVTHDDSTGKDYFATIISDATACCQQGLEFIWDGDHKYPDDYPQKGTEIQVEGVFGSYDETVGGQTNTYYYIRTKDIVKV